MSEMLAGKSTNDNAADGFREPGPTKGQMIRAALMRTDDGSILRWAFRGLLVAAIAILALDLGEMRPFEARAPEPFDPMAPGQNPILPPALTEGDPEAPPFEVTTDNTLLKQPIQFDLTTGGVMLARGAIDAGAASRFVDEIDARGEYVKVIDLDSPGGSVDDALAIGAIIRDRGLATRVRDGALCASSCPLIFASGVAREAEEKAVVGIHQVFSAGAEKPSPELAMSRAQTKTAEITRHLTAMGVDPALWLHALETAPDRLYYLTPDEMAEYRLTGKEEPAPDAGS